MKDVIQGPGEYKLGNSKPWICLAIIEGVAVGYMLYDGKHPAAGTRIARSGQCDENEPNKEWDVMPPEPVITGPGPYEMTAGGTWHCAYVDKNGIAYGFPETSTTVFQRDALTGRKDPDLPQPGDVIRKRVTP